MFEKQFANQVEVCI